MYQLGDLTPKSVFRYFEEICRIPHGSGNTKQISDYLVNFAVQHDLIGLAQLFGGKEELLKKLARSLRRSRAMTWAAMAVRSMK